MARTKTDNPNLKPSSETEEWVKNVDAELVSLLKEAKFPKKPPKLNASKLWSPHASPKLYSTYEKYAAAGKEYGFPLISMSAFHEAKKADAKETIEWLGECYDDPFAEIPTMTIEEAEAAVKAASDAKLNSIGGNQYYEAHAAHLKALKALHKAEQALSPEEHKAYKTKKVAEQVAKMPYAMVCLTDPTIWHHKCQTCQGTKEEWFSSCKCWEEHTCECTFCDNCGSVYDPEDYNECSECDCCENCASCGCTGYDHEYEESEPENFSSTPPWEERGVQVEYSIQEVSDAKLAEVLDAYGVRYTERPIHSDRVIASIEKDDPHYAERLRSVKKQVIDVDLAQTFADFYLLGFIAHRAESSAPHPNLAGQWRDHDLEEITTTASQMLDNLLEDVEPTILGYCRMAVWGEARYHPALGSKDRHRTAGWATGLHIERAAGPEVWDELATLLEEYRPGTSVCGKRWADAARIVGMRLQGKIDRFAFIDRSLSLQHNGGALFNKLEWKVENDLGFLMESIKSTLGPCQAANPPVLEVLWHTASEPVQRLWKRHYVALNRLRRRWSYPPLWNHLGEITRSLFSSPPSKEFYDDKARQHWLDSRTKRQRLLHVYTAEFSKRVAERIKPPNYRPETINHKLDDDGSEGCDCGHHPYNPDKETNVAPQS